MLSTVLVTEDAFKTNLRLQRTHSLTGERRETTECDKYYNRNSMAYGLVVDPSFASHSILDELLNLSVLQILYLQNRDDNDSTYFAGQFYGLNE